VWLAIAEAVPVSDGTSFSWGGLLVFLLYVALSFTDKIDGYLARSRNEVTTFGKFLDPIADKLEVVMALAFLLERGLCSSWVLLVVVAREFLVSGLRMVVASQGVVIAASNLGKAKTAVTMTAIGGYLLCAALPAGAFANFLHTVSFALMIAAVVLTAWSGIDYFIKSWPALNRMDA
jgi:CDP-diacylglycerol--glycerol-3-phosphate 3-phosphatidyltransferase